MAGKSKGVGRGFFGRFDGLPYTKAYGAGSAIEGRDEPFTKPKPGSICEFPVVTRSAPPDGKPPLKAEKQRRVRRLAKAVAKLKPPVAP